MRYHAPGGMEKAPAQHRPRTVFVRSANSEEVAAGTEHEPAKWFTDVAGRLCRLAAKQKKSQAVLVGN